MTDEPPKTLWDIAQEMIRDIEEGRAIPWDQWDEYLPDHGDDEQ